MMIKFGESGHPVFRATSPLSWGTLKSKGGGKWSVHFGADGDTIETVFRTIISVNQLSIFGAVSDLCDEYSACHVRTGRPVLGRTIWPIVRASKIIDNNTYTFDWSPCTRKIDCKSPKNEWKGSHNKIEWQRFVLMQDSWKQLKSDSTSWEKTLTSSYELQNRWHVVSTLCHETQQSTDPTCFYSSEHQIWARVWSHNQLPAR